MRQLFNILYSAHSTLQPEVVISLDAEKAFDRVEWEYLFTVLERFGFGLSFLSSNKILYSSPVASVRINNVTYIYFPLPGGPGRVAVYPLSYLRWILSLLLSPCGRRRGLREY
jgi:hypothetical protein